jgi:hypothetical protein
MIEVENVLNESEKEVYRFEAIEGEIKLIEFSIKHKTNLGWGSITENTMPIVPSNIIAKAKEIHRNGTTKRK